MGITSINSDVEEETVLKTGNEESNFPPQDEESVSFVESSSSCCVGIVDIVGSTKMAAGLSHSKVGKYYSIFLNTMTPIVKKFGGIVVKNGGDSLLYYFQGTPDDEKSVFLRCLECSLAMIAARCIINTKLYQEKIPPLSFRVSADYGKVTLAKSSNSSYHDIFGTPVNICSKINGKAQPNTVVIGGDLYQAIKNLPGYSFHETPGYSVGFKFQYPVYSIIRNDHQCKSMVKSAIEQALLDMGTPVLDTTSSRLFNKYNCLLSTCYEKPEYLRETLMDMFGNAHTGIVETIKSNLGDHIQQKPIMDFVERLGR
jgi:class 3 adenylate cyclase